MAVIERLLEVLKHDNIAIGYDCGCKFKKTLARSMIGPLTRARGVQFVVGLFYGHAHNCECQLYNLPTYKTGMGLSALENCELYFSKSNALASVVRHSTMFHQHQTMSSYFQHMDQIETFQQWSKYFAVSCLKTY